MATLGVPYRIMYLSRGPVTGLTDIKAVVLKPDRSVAGVFPLTEAPGSFAGCYFYDYYSAITDDPGDYFSKVFSPSEGTPMPNGRPSGVVDIVRFELEKGGGGSGDNVQSLLPTQLTAYVKDARVMAYVDDEREVWASVNLKSVSALVRESVSVVAELSDLEVQGALHSNNTILGVED